jgi:Tn3 transposase DDE domain
MVVPGTPRDSLYILDVLLNLDAGPRPDVVTTDTGSYSDMVHGVFAMLGYRFSPRYADLSDQWCGARTCRTVKDCPTGWCCRRSRSRSPTTGRWRRSPGRLGDVHGLRWSFGVVGV